ncbi:VOC family protein [Formosa sp. L2A11]|uniref:VOC family protein n=1 Tax=Formosa sp. L2A11 TaxID=2686363 RepID=UPI00131E9B67|nr:glyoxalase [Formosa sp. L2A11]
MKFKTLKLYTNTLESELKFYSETLGFKIEEQNENAFSVKIGWSELIFEKSEKAYNYHYCFLIPSNQLHQALEWMQNRTEIIALGNGRKIQNFKTWNADSFYFYDGSGNIAECIVRYDLNTIEETNFNASHFLCVNEIGIPTADIKKTNNQLETELNTTFWKGDFEIFGTNGSQEGLFLLPNYNLKDLWFPTSIKIVAEPFEAIIVNNKQEYGLEFSNENIKITPNL